jgi:sugar phosphate isomerase/epimerase
MKLNHGLHLAYCTNIHRGEAWEEILGALQRHTLAVRDQVAAGQPYAIGLRLGATAVRTLADPARRREFQAWLDRENCYVFTINGFPYGPFHGTRVKEQVYAPDWTTRERLDYTCLLFDLLGDLVPPGVEGSVSTVPVSFKGFGLDEAALRETRQNLWRCVEHIERVSHRRRKGLHLGLEPEPLCTLETTEETVRYFEQLRAERPGDTRINQLLGVNYDCCHLAVEYEAPRDAIERLRNAGVKLSKIHLSNALKARPTPQTREALAAFQDPVYFHQVVIRSTDGGLRRCPDLPDALALASANPPAPAEEWRIHYHIPLHRAPTALFDTTADHLLGVLDELKRHPALCSHLEMETYTWEVLPPELKQRDVTDQLVAEYQWTLAQLRSRGLAG